MFDIKLIRDNPDKVKQELAKRRVKPEVVDNIISLDTTRRAMLQEVEQLKAENNRVSGDIARLKKEGKDASEILAAMKTVSEKIKIIDSALVKVEADFNLALLYVPNMPHPSVPVGNDEKDNVLYRTWGKKPSFSFDEK